MSVRKYSFWGSHSPLGGLTGAGLLVMASARLSWAITVSLGLFWVYGLSALVFAVLTSDKCKKFFPKCGRRSVFTCIASFFGSTYLLLFFLLCQFAALEVFLPLLLIPLYCTEAGVYERIAFPSEGPRFDIFDHMSEAVSQAAVLSGLTIAFSILREPLSYCSLSFPGSSQGMITIMYFASGSFFPIGVFAPSAGALLLLGYFVCLYQYFKNSLFSGVNE